MNVIYDKLELDNIVSGNKEKDECINILNDVLQSKDKDYETYLSSQALEGTIVEEIGEVDAKIAILEKKIKNVLIQSKEVISDNLLDETSNETLLNQLHENLEQLWEMDPQSIQKDASNGEEEEDETLLSVDEILGMGNQSKSTITTTTSSQLKKDNSISKDEFHIALDKLRQRVIKKKNQEETQENLAFVLNNLQNITDLMELPFLTRTCIKTGHYQQAIMLYTYSKSLRLKFPDSNVMDSICDKVLNEINTTMLTGLVKLLSTNLSVNSIKKILNYLMAIPPFDTKGSNALLNIYLSMRYKFISNKIASYSLDNKQLNESLLEMTIKRKIEVVREHLYSSLNTYSHNFNIETSKFIIPLNKEIFNKLNPPRVEAKLMDVKTEKIEEPTDVSKEEKEEKEEQEKQEEEEEEENTTSQFPIYTAPVETNPLILQMVNNCVGYLLDQFKTVPTDSLNNSICLQLVYCSFRLNDLNVNYHHCFLNRLFESGLFTADQISQAIRKRAELASRYS
ncbi:conserved oligomeric Golgi complex subunit 8 [Monosporozyma unispora]